MNIGLLSILVGAIGALIATVWKASALVTQLQTSLKQVLEQAARTETRISMLNEIPLLSQKVETLIGGQAKSNSVITGLSQRLAVVETKVGSLQMRAVKDPTK